VSAAPTIRSAASKGVLTWRGDRAVFVGFAPPQIRYMSAGRQGLVREAGREAAPALPRAWPQGLQLLLVILGSMRKIV
jgi:hypothetical protein